MQDSAVVKGMVKTASLRDIALYCLVPGKYQPRQTFPEEGLIALADTMRQVGVLEPLVVRPLNEARYEIIAGERRFRAAHLAGLEKVPCLVRACTDAQAAQIALIENTCRESLNPLSEARAIQRLIEEFGYTHEEAGIILGKKRTAITNLLRILQLDKRLQHWIEEGALTEAHGKLLAGVDILAQYPLGNTCVKEGWSTRRLEKAIKKTRENKTCALSFAEKTAYISRIERQLSDRLGHEVTLDVKKDNTGQISIHFKGLDRLQGILEKLGLEEE